MIYDQNDPTAPPSIYDLERLRQRRLPPPRTRISPETAAIVGGAALAIFGLALGLALTGYGRRVLGISRRPSPRRDVI